MEKDQKKLLEKLSENLNRDELIELLEDSLAYRLGRIGYGEFYESLKSRCMKAGVQITPEMERYIGYVILVEGIDRENLFKEVRDLERKVWNALIQFSQQGEIVSKLQETDTDFLLLGKALDFRLSPEEWEEYGRREAEIRKIGQRIGMRGGESIPTSILNVLNNVAQFNQLSHARNGIFVKNLRWRMREKNAQISVLVAGGYHSQGVESKLKEQGISYITVRPNMEMSDVHDGYHPLNSFKGKSLPLESLFLPEKVSYAAERVLGDVRHDTLSPAEAIFLNAEGTLLPVVTFAHGRNSAKTFLNELTAYRQREGLESVEVTILEVGRPSYTHNAKNPVSDQTNVRVSAAVRMGGSKYVVSIWVREDNKDLIQRLSANPKEVIANLNLVKKSEVAAVESGMLSDLFDPSSSSNQPITLYVMAREKDPSYVRAWRFTLKRLISLRSKTKVSAETVKSAAKTTLGLLVLIGGGYLASYLAARGMTSGSIQHLADVQSSGAWIGLGTVVATNSRIILSSLKKIGGALKSLGQVYVLGVVGPEGSGVTVDFPDENFESRFVLENMGLAAKARGKVVKQLKVAGVLLEERHLQIMNNLFYALNINKDYLDLRDRTDIPDDKRKEFSQELGSIFSRFIVNDNVFLPDTEAVKKLKKFVMEKLGGKLILRNYQGGSVTLVTQGGLPWANTIATGESDISFGAVSVMDAFLKVRRRSRVDFAGLPISRLATTVRDASGNVLQATDPRARILRKETRDGRVVDEPQLASSAGLHLNFTQQQDGSSGFRVDVQFNKETLNSFPRSAFRHIARRLLSHRSNPPEIEGAKTFAILGEKKTHWDKDMVEISSYRPSEEDVRENVRVALRTMVDYFLAHAKIKLAGQNGAEIAAQNLPTIEEMYEVEIRYRWLWNWVRAASFLSDGRKLTENLFNQILDEEFEKICPAPTTDSSGKRQPIPRTFTRAKEILGSKILRAGEHPGNSVIEDINSSMSFGNLDIAEGAYGLEKLIKSFGDEILVGPAKKLPSIAYLRAIESRRFSGAPNTQVEIETPESPAGDEKRTVPIGEAMRTVGTDPKRNRLDEAHLNLLLNCARRFPVNKGYVNDKGDLFFLIPFEPGDEMGTLLARFGIERSYTIVVPKTGENYILINRTLDDGKKIGQGSQTFNKELNIVEKLAQKIYVFLLNLLRRISLKGALHFVRIFGGHFPDLSGQGKEFKFSLKYEERVLFYLLSLADHYMSEEISLMAKRLAMYETILEYGWQSFEDTLKDTDYFQDEILQVVSDPRRLTDILFEFREEQYDLAKRVFGRAKADRVVTFERSFRREARATLGSVLIP
ncbi:MAG: hypothetical protein HYY63_00980, partial [Elusimicrobia bacterium]|nr:hypothetical protein [Elusimicrobiota bacterium]